MTNEGMKAVRRALNIIAYAPNTEAQLTEKLLSLVQPGDTLWIKGSRGMKLEEVLSRLYERF